MQSRRLFASRSYVFHPMLSLLAIKNQQMQKADVRLYSKYLLPAARRPSVMARGAGCRENQSKLARSLSMPAVSTFPTDKEASLDKIRSHPDGCRGQSATNPTWVPSSGMMKTKLHQDLKTIAKFSRGSDKLGNVVSPIKSKRSGSRKSERPDTLYVRRIRTAQGSGVSAGAELMNTLVAQSEIRKSIRSSKFSKRLWKRIRPAPTELLSKYLDGRHSLDSEQLLLLCEYEGSRLPAIFLRYLVKRSQKSPLDNDLLQRLHTMGYSVEDLDIWNAILTNPSSEAAATEFLSSKSRKPTFVFLELLRRDKISAETFRSLLMYTWTDLMSSHSQTEQPTNMADTTFMVLICRLLRHARKVWSPSLVSLAHMTAVYCKRIQSSLDPTAYSLDQRMHARLSRIYNRVLLRLALPASISPMKSMDYNWRAQRVLLESAGDFKPPLELDKRSYGAVSRVILATRKSPKEEKFSSLLDRSWPPWRRETDGVDAARARKEDLSRVVSALSRMSEAGYEEEPIDTVIKILGGREPDGTPTIHTRHLLKTRQRHLPYKFGEAPKRYEEGNYDEWAAKIEATRDVQEAWTAFLSFPTKNGQPTMSMYYAMLKKLVYYEALVENQRPLNRVPGDGRELIPVVNDNISEDLKMRLRPPTVRQLHERMISEGYRPSGRCLNLLLHHAKSTNLVIRYLKSSGLSSSAVSSMIGERGAAWQEGLEQIPDSTLAVFISSLMRKIPHLRESNLTAVFLKASNLEKIATFPLGFKFPVMSVDAVHYNPIAHILELLQGRKDIYRPAWYALFEGLARRDLILRSRQHPAWNDQMSWALLELALRWSKEFGLELDPDGFLIICRGLEKAILARKQFPDAPMYHPIHRRRQLDPVRELNRGLELLKKEFGHLSTPYEVAFHLPRFAHEIRGDHLHAYVRVMGLARDMDEMKHVLIWMIEHQAELVEAASTSIGGWRRLLRVLVAMRCSVDEATDGDLDVGTGTEIKNMVGQLAGWGGWPSDDKVEEYNTWMEERESK